MKLQLITAAIASVSLGFALPSFGQPSFTHGESKHCESLSGEAKVQCDKEEATKTQGPAAQEPQPAAVGGTNEATKSQDQPASSPSWSNDSPQPSAAPAGAGAPPAGMSPD
ncbi:MAG: hypothetical protein QOD26_255 [Betaproteobacteria bacterium]|jgi:hypothetical protein|nr:hypothetical protein [Betaproteobacteria bacterium]